MADGCRRLVVTGGPAQVSWRVESGSAWSTSVAVEELRWLSGGTPGVAGVEQGWQWCGCCLHAGPELWVWPKAAAAEGGVDGGLHCDVDTAGGWLLRHRKRALLRFAIITMKLFYDFHMK